jgi:arylsulfatase A-like enzyme
MKAILIVMDTLNRHMLRIYNPQAETITPNIDRLALRSKIFDNHYIGSAPCMPARRDILTGRYNFLERGWGPIEPFDVTFTQILKKNNIFSHIVTDHCHYAELGGEGYMQSYDTWDLIRGQEVDAYVSRVKEPEYPDNYIGRTGRAYQWNRTEFKKEEDFPTPKTLSHAVKWLKDNEGSDNFFLQIECFDPHEPFDATEEFKKLYPDDFSKIYEWPRYDNLGPDETKEAIAHLRHMYMATLSMADKWLGKVFDEMDRQNMWDDTLVILTSDHGHMLGEHNATGKNKFPAWNEMCRIPLLVHMPRKSSSDRNRALTQNIDIFPTILDFFNIEYDKKNLHGKSWKDLYEDNESNRDYRIYGWFGKPVNITDGKYTYFKAPKERANTPLYQYYTIPTTLFSYLPVTGENISVGKYLKQTDAPVYRLDQGAINNGEMSDVVEETYKSMLFDVESDPKQQYDIKDDAIIEKMEDALREKLKEVGAPIEQFDRLGLN